MGYTIAALVIVLAVLLSCSAVVEAKRDQISDWEEYIEVVAEQYHICPELIEAIVEQESNWNPKAENAGCVGLMQLDARWQQERMERLGVTDLIDPYDNILVGTDFLAELFEEYEDIYAVLMYYNAGYSGTYGLGAWKDGRYSDYAVEVAERSAELEREHGK